MRRHDCWQPVAAICYVQELKQQLPDLPLDGVSKKAVLIWNDLNKDGAVQYDECQVLDKPFQLNAGWTHTISSDLSIFTTGMTRFKPIGFDDDGAPIYGQASIQRYERKQSGCFTPIFEDNLLIVAGNNHYPKACQILGMDLDTARVRWTYPNPFPGVHGSHRAPMPHAGLITGPLKICGIAQVSPQVGKVFMMRGNLGQDFYMTSDGLYVGAMFRDGRLPGETLPQNEDELPGRPIDALSMGGEPFSGWFGKQSDGVYRMLCGLPRESAMLCRVTGLETIRRFDGGTLNMTPTQLAHADQFNQQQQVTGDQTKSYVIQQASAKLMTDNKAWSGLPEITIAREGSIENATVKLAYDPSHLYLRFEVTDISPWKNQGKDFTRLFKTGDCVELYLSAVEPRPHQDPVAGDQRIIIAPYQNKATAVLMQVQSFGPVEGQRVTYRTGWSRTLANVALLDHAQIKVSNRSNGYIVVASIPLADLGLHNVQGQTLCGDVGMISSDANGTTNVSRACWSNQFTNLVNDEPQEAWLYPANWGSLQFE
jgi:hypothetical protein